MKLLKMKINIDTSAQNRETRGDYTPETMKRPNYHADC